MMKTIFSLLISFAIFSLAQGATILSEGSTVFGAPGEFSDDFANPTPFALMIGSNILEFTIGGGGSLMGGATNGSDADILAFQLPTGATLTSIRAVTTAGMHFFGAQFGSSFSFAPDADPNGQFVNALDGQRIFSAGSTFTEELTQDIFNQADSLGEVSQDFVALFQETAPGRASVTLEITVVPEPSSALLLLLGAFSLLRRKRDY